MGSERVDREKFRSKKNRSKNIFDRKNRLKKISPEKKSDRDFFENQNFEISTFSKISKFRFFQKF